MSSYSMAMPSTLPPTSSMAIFTPFTMLVVCALALPVRGRLLTIFSEPCARAMEAMAREAMDARRRFCMGLFPVFGP